MRGYGFSEKRNNDVFQNFKNNFMPWFISILVLIGSAHLFGVI